MIRRNPHIARLSSGYLFPEVARRRREYQAGHPEARIISLGIGNTTEPLSPHIVEALVAESRALGTREGYSGYGDEQGLFALREKIAAVLYRGRVKSQEVFVSDGAKCDIGRLQLLFGGGIPVAVQDPAYPVYVDGSVLNGAAGDWGGNGYAGIDYLPCGPENDFFPDLSRLRPNSILYFCSPNNPTGACATRAQLEALVRRCLEGSVLLVYDAAYSEYISDPGLPRSIYEIDGARRCAIEISSFSKPIGFTGVRLGWTVVPDELCYADGSKLNADWNRVDTTIFNGPSIIAQYGGLAALDEEGLAEMRATVGYYMGNAAIIAATLDYLGVEYHGGRDAPYLWARFPGRDSWEVFGQILERCQIVTTPGSGFGPAGQGFIRFSAFGHREDVETACQRLRGLGAM